MTGYMNQILNALLKNGDYMTANELANVVAVSQKTIYRSVKSINETYKMTLVESERGRGYLLNYQNYLQIMKQSPEKDYIAFSPVERRNVIILSCLFNAPFTKSIENLYHKFYVSETLIQQDVIQMQQDLSKYELLLHYEKGRLSISGNEESIRRAINNALIQNHAMKQETISDFVHEFKDINFYDNQFLTTQLDLIQRLLKTIIPYPYNVNIYSHLYILIKRFRSGKVNELVEINNLDEDERRIINNYQSVMKVSESVIRNTGDYLNTKLPSIESYYLLQYLISMRYKHDLTFNEQVQPEVLALTKAYISGFNITMNDGRVLTLQNDLISHIKPMLNRLNNRILIVNRLKKAIQTTYTTLFNKVTLISRKYEQLESTDWRISDDEVGFITLYFAKYFEENQTKKRILIMCASGIGTSKLLRVKVLRAFPEVEIVAVVSKYEYEKNIERYYDIDAIISTVNIETQQKVQVILTSAMFTKLDEQHVKEALYGNLY